MAYTIKKTFNFSIDLGDADAIQFFNIVWGQVIYHKDEVCPDLKLNGIDQIFAKIQEIIASLTEQGVIVGRSITINRPYVVELTVTFSEKYGWTSYRNDVLSIIGYDIAKPLIIPQVVTEEITEVV
jgi:hypothetical protein